jgi:hypothetical protein
MSFAVDLLAAANSGQLQQWSVGRQKTWKMWGRVVVTESCKGLNYT